MNCGIKNGKCYCSSGQCFPRNWLFGFHFGQWMITKSRRLLFCVLSICSICTCVQLNFQEAEIQLSKTSSKWRSNRVHRGKLVSGWICFAPKPCGAESGSRLSLVPCTVVSWVSSPKFPLYLFIYDQRLWPHIIWWVSHSSLWER